MTAVSETAAHVRPRQRWLARLSLITALAAAVLLVAVAGTKTIPLLLLVFASVIALLVGVWLAIAHRGWIRAAGVALALGSQAIAIVAQIRHHLLWLVFASVALWVLSVLIGRAALTPEDEAPQPVPERAPPAKHPYLIMNPRSGDGKALRFGLREKAEELGVEVYELEGSHFVDVADVARKAIASGVDLIGVAGGDGTQALVAAVATEHDVPMFVVPAGTRNHFALDLGIDRDDLGASLEALNDGVDIRVDLGDVEGRPFVNNVSFGAYAAIVERPDYREDKLRVSLRVLPDLLSGNEGPRLTAWVDGQRLDEPQALLVSNNRYGTGDLAGAGRRVRLDEGALGVVGVHVANARSAAGLARGAHSSDITQMAARDVLVESGDAEIPAGVDGESIMFHTPVHCQVRPGVLRVRVPRNRPGFAKLRPHVRLSDLLRLSLPGSAPGGHSA